jgi:excisionase family DNA binding protein
VDDASGPIREWLTPEQVAQRLGKSKVTIYRWSRKGEGPAGVRIGGTIKFDKAEVERWLSAQETVGGKPAEQEQ